MERSKNSISPDALYARLGSESAPIIVDVRRDADFSGADRLVADAFHCSPDNVEEWRTTLPSGREVVAYCVHGQQVSQGVAVVSLDGVWVFTGFDRALSQAGRIALWTKGDSIIQFDSIAIAPLPASQERY